MIGLKPALAWTTRASTLHRIHGANGDLSGLIKWKEGLGRLWLVGHPYYLSITAVNSKENELENPTIN
jgi:hypothetical protein